MSAPVDFAAFKNRQQLAWASGAYAVIGPVHDIFSVLPAHKAAALERNLTELLDGLNCAGTDSQDAPSEFLEIVITRR